MNRAMVALLMMLGLGLAADAVGGAEKQKIEVDYKKHFVNKPMDKGKKAKFSHAPYLRDDCALCHVSGNRSKPGKLKAPTNKLCLECHEPMARELGGHKLVHKPAAEKCDHCHNSHNSNHRYMLYDSPKQLCTKCHSPVGSAMKKARFKHDAASKGKACGNCHDAHGSSEEHLLRASTTELCLRCHGKDDVEDGDGRALTNMARLLEENPVHHNPVDKKNCSACHNPHGSGYYRLLVAAYPREFYTPYSREKYALCFKCHDEKAITSRETNALTGFRDGTVNLHSVHVIRDERSRGCGVCHGEHATKRAHLMREDVPFGSAGWRLKINWEPTATGGRCVKDCHDVKEYKNR